MKDLIEKLKELSWEWKYHSFDGSTIECTKFIDEIEIYESETPEDVLKRINFVRAHNREVLQEQFKIFGLIRSYLSK